MIGVVIPTRYNPPTLAPLLAMLEKDGIPVVLLQSEDFNHQLHKMWNTGVDHLRDMGCTEIGVLNDDITIASGTMAMLARALRENENAAIAQPLRMTGKPRVPGSCLVQPWHGEYVGHCFMFKAELPLPRFDETYHLWQGDIIFFDSVLKMGYDIITVRKLTIGHIRSFSVNKVRNSEEVQEDIKRYHGDRSATTVDWTGRRYTQRLIKKGDRASLIELAAHHGFEEKHDDPD